MKSPSDRKFLSLRELSLTLDGKSVIEEVNLDLWSNHVHALIGPNGAGKSTLASTIMGLSGYRDHEGDILFEGESIKGLSVDERAGRGITLGWQEPARFEGLRVDRFIRSSIRKSNPDDAAVRECLDAVGLEPARYVNRAVDRTLSGGERKRVELASILAMEPKLVLLDEPDSGIDVAALEKIFESIHLLKSRGATILMITHSVTVLRESEHAFLMCCGRVIDKGLSTDIAKYFSSKCIPCDHKNRPEEGETIGG